jgi:cell division septum initiation protein DivIVA
MTVSNIYKLLDKLEMKILKGMPIPLSPWVTVNHEVIIDILDKIRTSIPGEIQEAHSILKKRDEMQAEAQRMANQILIDAKHQSESMLSESELLRAVQAEADRIRQQVISDCEMLKKQTQDEAELVRSTAINEAIAMREGSDKYAEAVLANLERDLGELHEVVKNGQKHLAKIKADSFASLTAQRTKNSMQINNIQNTKL